MKIDTQKIEQEIREFIEAQYAVYGEKPRLDVDAKLNETEDTVEVKISLHTEITYIDKGFFKITENFRNYMKEKNFECKESRFFYDFLLETYTLQI